MRKETATWVEPLFDEALRQNVGRDEIAGLMRQATMPAAETDNPIIEWTAENMPPGTATRGLDWVRFGQLLRERVGWDHYPEHPPTGGDH